MPGLVSPHGGRGLRPLQVAAGELAQEHQRFFLLQQNEASDWADIMPRSGFVLYSNALWHRVKQLYDLPHRDETLYHFDHIEQDFQKQTDVLVRAVTMLNGAVHRLRTSRKLTEFSPELRWR